MATLLGTGLSDSNSKVRMAALRSFSAVANASVLREDLPLSTLVDLLPSVVALATAHPERHSDEYAQIASTVFDVLAILMDVVPQDKVNAYFCDASKLALRIFADHAASSQARSAANEFLVFAIATKPSTLRKLGVADACIQTACEVVFHNASRAAAPPDMTDDDVDDTDHDPVRISIRLLYALAKRPELARIVFVKVMEFFRSIVDSSAVNPNPSALGASYRLISAIAEGCSLDLTALVREIFPHLANGAVTEASGFAPRARALEALGCVCDSLDTYEMPDELIEEVANAALNAVLAGLNHSQPFVCKQACIALEPVVSMFVQDSETLRPRVGEILRALGALGNQAPEEAVMAIGVLAENAPDAFVESDMYVDVIKWIVQVMSNTGDDNHSARAAAIGAAAALMASCKDPNVIEELASNAILGLESEEPELKQATFSFFARMADEVGGSVVAVFGPKILKAAMESMEKETISFGREEEEDEADPGLWNTGGDDDDNENAFEVHTARLDEKTVAVATVGAFASACATIEYIDRVAQTLEVATSVRDLFSNTIGMIDGLTNFFQEDVRAASYHSLCRMAVANTWLSANHPALAYCQRDLVEEGFSRILYGMREDDDIAVVTNLLSSTSAFFDRLSADVLNTHKVAIVTALNDFLLQKMICQMSVEGDVEQPGGEEDDDGDPMEGLIEGVGEVIEAMARSLRGYFVEDFAQLLKVMITELYSKNSSVGNRSTVLGTTAAVLLHMNWERCAKFSPPAAGTPEYDLALSVSDNIGCEMLPIAMQAVKSPESKTLRQNAMFLIGVIFSKCWPTTGKVWELLPQALQTLEEILTSSKGSHGALVDNAAGALSRILRAPGVPPGAIPNRRAMLQAILNCVPLQNDPSENTTIARALIQMSEVDEEFLRDQNISRRAVSCIVTAVLMFWSAKTKKLSGSWSMDVDPCDEMVSLDEVEVSKLLAVIRQVSEKVDENVIAKLKLSNLDSRHLEDAIRAYTR